MTLIKPPEHGAGWPPRFAERELAQLAPRALVYATRDKPLPLLVRPPFLGRALFAGEGVSYSDEDGHIDLILSNLSIERLSPHTDDRAADALGRIWALWGIVRANSNARIP